MGAEAEASLLRGGRLGVVPAFAPVTAFALRPVPLDLTLDRVARSHGWVGLPPYGYYGDHHQLFLTLAIGAVPTTVRVDRAWSVAADRALLGPESAELRASLRWSLGLDDDVTGAPPSVRATRMLRSSTVWEDLVKTLMTTNCSWSATVGMVTRLVDNLGFAGCFPPPSVVAEAGADVLRDVIRMGYRAGSLCGLAGRIASEEIRPESWRDNRLSDEEILSGILTLPGFGRYSAEGMLGLLGRPRGHAVDSWIRARLNGATAAEIAERYAVYGRWAGAALWQDVTAPWFA